MRARLISRMSERQIEVIAVVQLRAFERRCQSGPPVAKIQEEPLTEPAVALKVDSRSSREQ
jgi:hypothetical protein